MYLAHRENLGEFFFIFVHREHKNTFSISQAGATYVILNPELKRC